MATFSGLEASVRGSIDATDTGRTPQALILALSNEEYEECVRRIAGFAPDYYRTISGNLAITDTAVDYLDIASLTTLMQVLEVQRLCGVKWLGLGAAGVNPEADCKLTWRQRGLVGTGTKIDIFPAENSIGTYRVLYTAFPGALTVSPDAEIKLPLGGQKYLAACVSARLRHREEESEAYMVDVRDTAFASLVRGLQPKGGVIQTRGKY